MKIAALVLAALALGGCGTSDLVGDEIDAQKDKVENVIEDPVGAADEAAQDELRRRGVDGQAPPLRPGQ